MSKSAKHIEFDTLLDVADRRLDQNAEQAAHLDNCTPCAEELLRLQNLLALMKDDKAADAPRDVLSYAVNLFARREQKPTLVQRIVAALSFDSSERAPAYGVRSGATTSRQLIYSAGENDIDLRINEEENDNWVIAGQVLGQHCASAQLSLRGYEVSRTASLNQQCEFTLPAVPAGSYELVFHLGDLEVEVPRLEIGV